jgi:hypothetical protein
MSIFGRFPINKIILKFKKNSGFLYMVQVDSQKYKWMFKPL